MGHYRFQFSLSPKAGAKLQQIFELTKYFAKKVQFSCNYLTFMVVFYLNCQEKVTFQPQSHI